MLTTKGAIIAQKQEMTRLWVGDKMLPVTIVKLVDQEIVGYKTTEKDGYSAVVIGTERTDSTKEKGPKVSYRHMSEFHVDPSFADQNPVGTKLSLSSIEGIETLRVTGISRGKGFQGVMKRHNFRGGERTHGSKFHRVGGSTGNRKPRRTHRGHPMAGHMGTDTITLKAVPVIGKFDQDGEQLIALKGSIPGGRNMYLQLIIM